MDLEDVDCWARFMFRDRDGKVPVLFDTVLTNAGIEAHPQPAPTSPSINPGALCRSGGDNSECGGS
ncbi:hypothetical protein ACFV8Z_26840 [Streptomyces sp. NPDC059837]